MTSSRLVGIPFAPLNYTLGVTSVGWRAYVVGTVVGLVPGTAAVVLLGDAVTGGISPAMFVMFAVSGTLGAGGILVSARGRRRHPAGGAAAAETGPPRARPARPTGCAQPPDGAPVSAGPRVGVGPVGGRGSFAGCGGATGAGVICPGAGGGPGAGKPSVEYSLGLGGLVRGRLRGVRAAREHGGGRGHHDDPGRCPSAHALSPRRSPTLPEHPSVRG